MSIASDEVAPSWLLEITAKAIMNQLRWDRLGRYLPLKGQRLANGDWLVAGSPTDEMIADESRDQELGPDSFISRRGANVPEVVLSSTGEVLSVSFGR